jgi:hypothetical protein
MNPVVVFEKIHRTTVLQKGTYCALSYRRCKTLCILKQAREYVHQEAQKAKHSYIAMVYSFSTARS